MRKGLSVVMSDENQDLIEQSKASARKIYEAITKDGVTKKFVPDLIVEELTEDQFINWKAAVEKEDSQYFIKKTVGVEMTPEQHKLASDFVNDAFSKLTADNNYEFKEEDHLDVVFTIHYFKRLKERSSRKITISYEHTASLTEFVTDYKNVETAFRFNDDGVSYRLKNDKPKTDPTSYERVSFALLPSEDGNKLLINFITFINKKDRKPKPKRKKPQTTKKKKH